MEDKILLVDDNETIIEIMSLYVESFGDNEVLTATSGNSAIETLQNSSGVGLIISDFNMPDGTGGDLYTYVQKTLPNIPFILQTAEPLELLEEFTEFPSHGKEFFLQKPFTNDQVNDALEAIFHNETDSEKPREYVKVSISTFHKYSRVGVDAYIKLSESKYVKFHHYNDELDADTLKKYEQKGIEYFYLTKDDYRKFIDSCQNELNQKLLTPNLSSKEIAQVRLDSAENIHQSLISLGVNEFTLEQSEKITANVIESMPKKSDIAALLKEMQNGKSYVSQLSVLTGNVAVALAEQISWADKKSYEKLMMASMFMDLYWIDESSEYIGSNYSEITYNDSEKISSLDNSVQDIVFFHSQRSAQIFDKAKSDGDIYNLIVDHHERPAGRGFPKRSNDEQISSMAAILILAHEFSHRMITTDKLTLESFSQIKLDITNEFSNGRFKEPLKSFIQVFS